MYVHFSGGRLAYLQEFETRSIEWIYCSALSHLFGRRKNGRLGRWGRSFGWRRGFLHGCRLVGEDGEELLIQRGVRSGSPAGSVLLCDHG